MLRVVLIQICSILSNKQMLPMPTASAEELTALKVHAVINPMEFCGMEALLSHLCCILMLAHMH